MATHITLDSIETNQNFDHTKLYDSQHNFLDNDDDYDEEFGSPFDDNHNNKYYTVNEIPTILTNTNKYLSIFNQNCQSLNAHWDNFKQQIIELENNKLKFDVIGLTETYRLIAPVEHFRLEGYHPFISKVRPPNDDNRGGGGRTLY